MNMIVHGWHGPKPSIFRVAVVLVCLFAYCPGVQADGIYVGDKKADTILFLGNSLTYHPYNADIGWTGDWGMAASAAENDYAHLVTKDIADRNHGNSPAMIATNIYLYGMFEQKYATYDVDSELESLIDWGANIVVVQLGDNSSASLTSQAAIDAYTASYGNLLTAFKNSSQHPELFILSTWWGDLTTDGIIRQACTDAGGTFVNIGGLYGKTANQGGWGGHPSDAGMAAIADTLLRAMIPEPSSMVILGSAMLFLGGLGWIRRTHVVRMRERR